jgi:thioredoxin-related protein
MKKIIFSVLAWSVAFGLQAADLAWKTDLPAAEAQAKKEGKLVLLDFTGSDWCGWCKKLDAEVFTKPEFEAYARKNLVLVEVDFPAQKPQSASLKAANAALGKKYQVDGYPTLILLTPDGKQVWNQVGYAPLSDVVQGLKSAQSKAGSGST